MEFKVWVDGIKRVVCGVTEETTCQDVILALAHATGQTGRFTLMEKWRNNERYLLPEDNPLKIMHKWGEYASDVHFILQKSGRSHNSGKKNKDKLKHEYLPADNSNLPSGYIKKSLTFSGAHSSLLHLGRGSTANSSFSSCESADTRSSPAISNVSRRPQASVPPFKSQDSKLLDPREVALQSGLSTLSESDENNRKPDKKNKPGHLQPQAASMISDDGGIRSPGSGCSVPSPQGTLDNKRPVVASKSQNSGLRSNQNETFGLDYLHLEGGGGDASGKHVYENSITEHGSLQDLVKLVGLQKERLQLLNSQMEIMDSEIQFWEEKDQMLQQKVQELQEELEKVEAAESKYEVEIKEVDSISWVEKIELEQKKEKDLRSEITDLESHLLGCDSEMEQYKNQIHQLLEDIKNEQDLIQLEQKEKEKEFLAKISSVQQELQESISLHEVRQESLDALMEEIKAGEKLLHEKTTKVAELEKQIRLLNLDMFCKMPLETVTSEDKSDDKGGAKSPRPPGRKLANLQHLGETVATPKNPHGMWV